MQGKLAISKDVLVLALVASILPVWRCGLREDLTFWGFVREHTIWGSEVEYIPEEYYGEQNETPQL